MKSKKLSGKNLGYINVILGLLIIGLGFLLLLTSIINIFEVLLIHAIAIFIIGIAKITNSLSNEKLNQGLSTWKFIIGLLAVLLAVMVLFTAIFEPLFLTVEMLVALFGFVFLLIGLEQIAKAIITKSYLNWYRVLILIVGIVNFILSIGIIIILQVNPLELIFLSILLIANGIVRFFLGIIGTE
ncbi:MAG: DUF308 domain-containing protein [Candidatus Lokiarchaeota archaeon]